MARKPEMLGVVSRRSFVARSASALAGTVLATQQLQGAVQKESTLEVLDPKLVEDLVLANHILANEGIVDAFGHVSVRHNKNHSRYLLARHVAPALVSTEDILEYDLDSNPISAKDKSPYLERFIHGEIYKARPDVMSVVHSHSPSVIPFSVSSVPLQPVFHMAPFVVEGIPVFDSRVVPGPKQRLVASTEAGRFLAQTLGNHPAVLILGHGTAVVGTSLQIAVSRSIYLEMSARIQAQAIALGGHITYIDLEAARRDSGMDYGQHAWDFWTRRAEKGKGR